MRRTLSGSTLITPFIALWLTACATAPSNQTPAVLTFWPETSESTLTLFTQDSEAAFNGGDLALGDAERSTRGVKNAAGDLQMSWQNAWWAGVRFNWKSPRNLSGFTQGGFLLKLKINDLAQAGLDVAMDCGVKCERKLSLTSQLLPLAGKGWQNVFLPISCLVRDGDDFSGVSMPLRISGGGTANVEFASISLQQTTPVVGTRLSCPDYKTVSIVPAPLDEHWARSWWIPRHEQKLQEAKTFNPELVFLGDSITQGWQESGDDVWNQAFAPWRSLNLGFSGDRTENVLWRLAHGEVDNINPKLVVMMIGTNNTGHRMDTPETVALGIKTILDELKTRLPDTQVLLLAIFPRGSTPDDPMRVNNTLINARIRNFADNERVFFADLNSVFLNQDGHLSEKVMPDLLHPEAYGYQLLADKLVPLIQKHITQ